MTLDLNHSALRTAGEGAEQIAGLFYWMATGAVVIWVVVIGLATYAIFSRRAHDARTIRRLVIGGGALVPTIVLTTLLIYALSIMPDLHRPAPEGSLRIRVAGVRWWWRVRYEDSEGGDFVTANEIHLPVDQPVQFELVSEDVIHSFWVPSLGGKMDMIPGRTNRLTLHPNREGVFAGICAEYCGTAHAQMKFPVIVEDAESFQRWQSTQRRSAEPGNAPGLRVFLSRGCSACHAIRGTQAAGVVGPDLTHFGSRRSIGAGILANDRQNLRRWITETHAVKPGVEMPAFRTIDDDELMQLVDYLESLR